MDVWIANDDRENLFAEIHYDNEDWAEVIYDDERGAFTLTIFKPRDGKDSYVFLLSDVQEALAKAKQRLIDAGYGNSDEQEQITLA